MTIAPLAQAWIPIVRWLLLSGLLVLELIGLSIGFDTAAMSTSTAWWTRAAGDIPVLLRIVLAFVGALLLLLAPRLRSIAVEAAHHARRRWIVAGCLHLLAFGLFTWTTVLVFGADDAGRNVSFGLLLLWTALGAVTMLAWFGAMAPAGFWLGLLRRERAVVAIAAGAGVLAWLMGVLAQQLWRPLAASTFWLSKSLLEGVYPAVVADLGNLVLGTPNFRVRIDASCSGYEGMALISVFLALYLWLFRREVRFPQGFLLFPIGLLAIWFGNALRVALLIAIGTSYSPAVALGGFHSQAGWLAFIVVALGLIVVMRRIRIFSTGMPLTTDVAGNPFATALLLPMLVLLAGITLTSAFSAGFDRLYPLRIVATAAALWCFRATYLRWAWRPSWHAAWIGGAVFLMWVLLEPVDGNTGLREAVQALPPSEAAIWITARIVGSALVIPLAEELAFRGYLLRALSGSEADMHVPPRFTWLSLILTSLAFGMLHSRWLAGLVAGLAYAWAYHQRGRFADAVAAHVVTNTLIVVAVLAAGQWALWS